MSLVKLVEETSKHFFALGPNFLDPMKTSDGKPYGPFKFKALIKELYVISKNCHTSYTDLLNITPTEKDELINLIVEDSKRQTEAWEKQKQAAKNKKENSRR